MIPRTALPVLGVVAAFLAIFVPLALRINGGRDRAIDAARMRRVYAALALYATTHDGLPAPNLALVRQDVDPLDLQSVADPHAAEAGPFALDPLCPSPPSPTRVSWSYRWHWKEAGRPARLDPRQGVLADPWLGVRVNEDGSVVEGSKGPEFSGLFGK